MLDQSFKQEPLPNVRSFSVVRVLVPAEQVARAREVLARPVNLPETATDIPPPLTSSDPEPSDD